MIATTGHKKGFGLIEVMVASLIIITVGMALMYVARTSLGNMSELEKRSQATYLAQEAMEMVRQIRDTNYIDGDPASKWSSFINASDAPNDSNYFKRFNSGKYQLTDSSAFGKVRLGNTEFDVWIRFYPILSTNILSNPKILSSGTDAQNDQVRRDKAYNVEVTAGTRSGGEWETKIVLNELLTDSRQGF